MKLKNVINKHKSNKITENSNTVRHLNNGTDHRPSKSCCDQSSPARRTKTRMLSLCPSRFRFRTSPYCLMVVPQPSRENNKRRALHQFWVMTITCYVDDWVFAKVSFHESKTWCKKSYCQTSYISHTLLCNKIVDHSDVVGASPVGAAPTTSSFLT